jgi:hypothetical protein
MEKGKSKINWAIIIALIVVFLGNNWIPRIYDYLTTKENIEAPKNPDKKEDYHDFTLIETTKPEIDDPINNRDKSDEKDGEIQPFQSPTRNSNTEEKKLKIINTPSSNSPNDIDVAIAVITNSKNISKAVIVEILSVHLENNGYNVHSDFFNEDFLDHHFNKMMSNPKSYNYDYSEYVDNIILVKHTENQKDVPDDPDMNDHFQKIRLKVLTAKKMNVVPFSGVPDITPVHTYDSDSPIAIKNDLIDALSASLSQVNIKI